MMHDGTRMAEITQFYGILPPAGQAAVAPSGGAESLIQWALAPLQVELNAALPTRRPGTRSAHRV